MNSYSKANRQYRIDYLIKNKESVVEPKSPLKSSRDPPATPTKFTEDIKTEFETPPKKLKNNYEEHKQIPEKTDDD